MKCMHAVLVLAMFGELHNEEDLLFTSVILITSPLPNISKILINEVRHNIV